MVRDTHVDRLFALHGVLLYHRDVKAGTRTWMRVVDGRHLRVRGMPRRVVAWSIGRDRAGRIVVVTSPPRRSQRDVHAWTYDVVGDVARPLPFPVPRSCSVETASLWRTRLAYFECYTPDIVVREPGRVRHLDVGAASGVNQLVLRGRSLAAIVDLDSDYAIWRIMDRGRWCPRQMALVNNEEEGYTLGPIGLGTSSLLWGTTQHAFDVPPPDRFFLSDVDLSGRCRPKPTVRLVPAPIAVAPRAAALDGRLFYYASDRAVYRQALPPR